MRNLISGTQGQLPIDAEQAAFRLQGAILAMVNPLLIVIGAMGAIFAIWLGVRLAIAQDESKRKEAKSQLIWSLIAVVIVFAVIAIVTTVFPAPDESLAGILPY